jgi:hypothetical protein
MDVEMVDGLAAVFSGVDHQAVTLDQVLLAGDLGGSPQQMPEQRGIRLIGVVHRDNVIPRRDQNMNGGLGVKVGEGVAELVLVDRSGGDASVNDLAK